MLLQRDLSELGFGSLGYSKQFLKGCKSGKRGFYLKQKLQINELTSVKVELYIKKNSGDDDYYLCFYLIQLKRKDKKWINRSCTFHPYEGVFFTLEEAINLLHGRHVRKCLTSVDQSRYTSWVYLEVKGDKELFDAYLYWQISDWKGEWLDIDKALLDSHIYGRHDIEYRQLMACHMAKGNCFLVRVQVGAIDMRCFVMVNAIKRRLEYYSFDTGKKIRIAA